MSWILKFLDKTIPRKHIRTHQFKYVPKGIIEEEWSNAPLGERHYECQKCKSCGIMYKFWGKETWEIGFQVVDGFKDDDGAIIGYYTCNEIIMNRVMR